MWGLLGVLGCDPGPASDEGSTSSTGSATDTGSTGPMGTTAVDDGSDGTDGTADTGQPADPCLLESPEACPPGCMLVEAVAQSEVDACDVAINVIERLCVGAGEPIAEDTRTTYYAMIDGQLRFLVVGQPCVSSPPAQPTTWSECTGAAGEPQPCACLCGANGCPAEAELDVLLACGLATPCGELVPHEQGLGAGTYDQCVLAALRDRTPGTVGSRIVGVQVDETHAFLDGSDEVQIIHQGASDLCTSPVQGWDPVQRCTLRDPMFFDDCLAGDAMTQNTCLLGEQWVQGCSTQPPECP